MAAPLSGGGHRCVMHNGRVLGSPGRWSAPAALAATSDTTAAPVNVAAQPHVVTASAANPMPSTPPTALAL
jgi:hypothetical protein